MSWDGDDGVTRYMDRSYGYNGAGQWIYGALVGDACI